MSYSLSAGGDVAHVRAYLRSGHVISTRGGRAAAALLNAEIDILEAQGATHVVVAGSGHEGGHSLSIYRDTNAEAEHVKNVAGVDFDLFFDHALQYGYLTRDENGIAIHAPERSKLNNAPPKGAVAVDECAPEMAVGTPRTLGGRVDKVA